MARFESPVTCLPAWRLLTAERVSYGAQSYGDHMRHQQKSLGEHKDANDALLKFLSRADVLTPELVQAAEAELYGGSQHVSAVDWVVKRGIIGEDELARTLAERLRLPFVNLPEVALQPSVTGLLREEIATRYKVVALRIFENSLVIATANPLDRDALRAVEFAVGKRVHVEVATATAVQDALEHVYHLEEALDAYLRGVPDERDIPIAELAEDPADIRGLLHGTELPPVVKLFNLVLLEGIRAQASDVHIEANQAAVRVRYRIDGILEESFRLPKWVQDPLTARCKVLARLDITERRVPQDGRLQVRYRDSMVDLRVSVLPTQFGEKVTLRILNAGAAPTGLDFLNLSPRDVKCTRQAIARPQGMVIVTGPTGSGKTTTLYGMIAEIISPTRNIVTVENPIEFQMRGVNQVEINDKQGLTFAKTLRSILRQDPDVILIGEIRDSETAEIALRAAQTGHLVLTTLHTNDAVSTISRLADLGIEPYMMATSLNLIMAQRLVRRVCMKCAEPYEPDAEAIRILQIDRRSQQFLQGRGCKECHKSGYSGRVGVFEVMSITSQMAKLIETNASESALRAQASAEGMVSLVESAAMRIKANVTTLDEVLRVVDITATGARCPGCERVVEETFAVCPHCATALRFICSNCNMKLDKDWQTCPYCGTATKLLTAPSKAVIAAPPPTLSPAAANVETSAPRMYRALIVDDEADMRRLIAFALKHSDLPIVVVEATNGHEALELAQDEPPDFVILDVMMPGMDGFEVCEQLRQNVRTAFVPILMLTALDDPGSRERGFIAGTDDYVSKPFARGELLARVHRILQRTYGTTLSQNLARTSRRKTNGDAARLSA